MTTPPARARALLAHHHPMERLLAQARARFVGKRRIDTLFILHAVFAALVGALGFVAPHVFEWCLIHHGERLRWRDNGAGGDASKVTHLVVRLYCALIAGQAWIVWHARTLSDAHVKRALVQVRVCVRVPCVVVGGEDIGS